MSSDRPFVPTDADGWPILDHAILTPNGWESPASHAGDWASQLAPGPQDPLITPSGPSSSDDVARLSLPRPRRRPIPLVPVVAAVLAVTLGTLAWYGAHRSGVPVSSIRPGNCLSLPGLAEDLPGRMLTRFDRVDCTTPHNAEVLATTTFDTSAPFPGSDSLSRTATTTCQAAVPPAIRTHPDAATWSVVFFGPISANTYHQGEVATLVCVVTFPDARDTALHG